jgi:lysozyme
MDSVLRLTTDILKVEEGFREDVYLCSEGYPTVGYGVKLGYKHQSLQEYRDFPKIPESVASQWLSELLSELLSNLKKDHELSYIFELDDVRMAVVLSMCYQLGISGFKKFKMTNHLLQHKLFYEASVEMCDSLWFKQTPNRAKRHSSMIETGVVDSYYKE